MKDRMWWTRQCRIQAESRLIANHKWTQYLLYWYSIFSIGIAVSTLKYETFAESDARILFVLFSIFTFTISLFLSSSRFRERAIELKSNYTEIQSLIEKWNSYEKSKSLDNEVSQRLIEQYTALLDLSENHSAQDDSIAVVFTYYKCIPKKRKRLLTRFPQCIDYWVCILYFTKRSAMILIAFSIPIITLVSVLKFDS